MIWAEEEFGGADLGDKRLNQRLVLLADRLGEQPSARIPEACRGSAEMHAAYHFLGRDALEWLTALRGDATPILTHVEDASPDYRRLAAGNPLWLQGYAYGHPEAGEAARPAPVATAD